VYPLHELRGITAPSRSHISLKEQAVGTVTEQDIMDWSREQMAAYKFPRIVEFVRSLPMSGSGKILWRVLQEEELKKQKQA
jgi:fatty-acyl-CoA synthase